MKKIFSIVILCLLTGFFIYANGQASQHAENYRIYFVDRQLHRLIPLPFPSEKSPEKTAKDMVSAIIKGKDYNPEILRLFPEIKDCITVEVLSDTAYANLSSELSFHINKTAETEKLFVYQIVNSLTSIDGIDYVQFTIDGTTQKDFLGFLDMREIFTAERFL